MAVFAAGEVDLVLAAVVAVITLIVALAIKAVIALTVAVEKEV